MKAHLARRAVAQDLGELEVGVPDDPMVVVVQGLRTRTEISCGHMGDIDAPRNRSYIDSSGEPFRVGSTLSRLTNDLSYDNRTSFGQPPGFGRFRMGHAPCVSNA